MNSRKTLTNLIYLWLLASASALVWMWINTVLILTPLWLDVVFGTAVIIGLLGGTREAAASLANKRAIRLGSWALLALMILFGVLWPIAWSPDRSILPDLVEKAFGFIQKPWFSFYKSYQSTGEASLVTLTQLMLFCLGYGMAALATAFSAHLVWTSLQSTFMPHLEALQARFPTLRVHTSRWLARWGWLFWLILLIIGWVIAVVGVAVVGARVAQEEMSVNLGIGTIIGLILLVSLFTRPIATRLIRRYAWLTQLAGLIFFLGLIQGGVYAILGPATTDPNAYLASIPLWLFQWWYQIYQTTTTLPARLVAFFPYGVAGGTLLWLGSLVLQWMLDGLRTYADIWLLRYWRKLAVVGLLLVAWVGVAYLPFYTMAAANVTDTPFAGLPTRVPRTEVNTLFEDTTQQLWLASNDGVYRFNKEGETWERLNAGLPGNLPVQSLTETSDGQLWAKVKIGFDYDSPETVYRFNKDKERWEIVNAGLPDNASIESLTETSDGQLWARVEIGRFFERLGKVYRFNQENELWKPANNGLPDEASIESLTKTNDNQLWAVSVVSGNSNEVYRFNSENERWLPISNGLPDVNSIEHLRETSDGQLWAIVRLELRRDLDAFTAVFDYRAKTRLYRLNRANELWKSVNSGLPDDAFVQSLTETKDGQLWVISTVWGNSDKIYKFNRENQRWELVNIGLPNVASILDIIESTDGELWTKVKLELRESLLTISWEPKPEPKTILYRFKKDNYTWEFFDSGLPNGVSVQDLTPTNNGQLWTKLNNVMYRFNKDEELWEPLTTGLRDSVSGSASSLTATSKGQLWASLNGGVYRFDKVNKLWVPINAGLPDNLSVLSLTETSDGQLWVESIGDTIINEEIFLIGKNVYNFKKNSIFKYVNSVLPDDIFVQSLTETNDGQLWLMGNTTFYRFDKEDQQWQELNAGLSDVQFIESLIETSNGRLWARVTLRATTQDPVSAVYHFNPGNERWEVVNAGLPNNVSVESMTETNSEHLWIQLANGRLYRLHQDHIVWELISTRLPNDMSVESLTETLDGQLWGMTGSIDNSEKSDVYRFNNLKERWELTNTGLPDKASIESFTASSNGQFWLWLTDSVYRFNKGHALWEIVNTGLPDNASIEGFTESSDGQLWLRLTDGVYHFNEIDRIWEAMNSGLPNRVSVQSLTEANDGQLFVTLNDGVYQFDTDDNRWQKLGPFLEQPRWIVKNNFEDTHFIKLKDLPIRVYDGQQSGQWIGSRTAPEIEQPTRSQLAFGLPQGHYNTLCIICKLNTGNKYIVPSMLGTSESYAISWDPDLPAQVKTEATIEIWYDEDGRLWVSPDGLAWNPVAHSIEGPLGARVDEGGKAVLWSYAGAKTIKEYTVDIPFYLRFSPIALAFALGRSRIYWFWLIGLGLLAVSYVGWVYVRAGRPNNISVGQFFSLDWQPAGLLEQLLSRDESSYTALRVRVGDLPPLAQLLYLVLDVEGANTYERAWQALSRIGLVADRSDLAIAFATLTARKLFHAQGESYYFAQPTLATVYQHTFDQAQLDKLINRARAQNPAYADAARFFTQSGFNVVPEADNVLLLQPTSPALRKRLGPQVLVHIMGEQPVRGADIQAVAQAAQDVYGGESVSLEGRVAFMIADQSPESGARAQMYAYRFDEGFIVVPFSRGRLRSALATDTCLQELDQILNDYLSQQSDLYDRSIPVRDENFFGRVQVSEELQTYLNQNQPLGIFALNKMGKTSLVRNLAERLTDRAVAVIDLQVLPKEATAVYTEMVRGLVQDMRSKWNVAAPVLDLLADTPPDNLAAALAHDLTTLHNLLAKQTAQARFVIFIDEIDRLIPSLDANRASGFTDYGDLLMSLRGLSQQGLPLTFVVVGLRAHINRAAQLAGVENAGFQMFRELFLPPMPEEECNQMISDIGQQMGLKYSPESLSRVYVESGGHPFLARQLCSLAWQQLGQARHNGRITTLDEKALAEAADAFIDSGRGAAYLEETWRIRLSSAEQAVVQRLAAADTPQSRGKGERQAMNSLVERHIIIREGNTYRLSCALFRRWVRAYVLELEE